MNEILTAQGVEMFTGGDLETNSYLIPCPEGAILIDAPEGSAEAFKDQKISLLVLTHGHFDHVWDAAEVARIHGCPVAMHSITEEMLADRGLLRRLGIDLEVEPVKADRMLLEEKGASLLYGGDVLFAGGVGRWDRPGGDRDLLLSGIRTKLLPLPPETVVLPGHGPATTIGRESASNPYLQ